LAGKGTKNFRQREWKTGIFEHESLEYHEYDTRGEGWNGGRGTFSTKLSVMKDYPDKMTVEPDS
jgi:hypothetical protein